MSLNMSRLYKVYDFEDEKVWMMKCPHCGNYVIRKDITIPATCKCGWKWNGN